ncbi:tail fiber assembly protein, partial [Xenorhabdus bovienii]
MNQSIEPMVQFDKNGFALSYGWAKVYCASTVTREYLGTKLERTSIGLSLSAGAYLDAPPLRPSPNKTICRTIDGQAWEYAPDYRGETAYHTQTGQLVTIVEIGNIPAELTLLEPKTFFDKWDGKQWVTDKIAQQAYEVQQAESQKQSRMSQA